MRLALLTAVGALRVPVRLSIPSETRKGLSVNAFSALWQVPQPAVPVLLKRVSSKSVLPSSTLASL